MSDDDFFASLLFTESVGSAKLTTDDIMRAMDDISRRSTFPCECGGGTMYRLMETDDTVVYRERCGCGEQLRKYRKVTAPAAPR